MLGRQNRVDQVLNTSNMEISNENIQLTIEALLDQSGKWPSYKIKDSRNIQITTHSSDIASFLSDLEYMELVLTREEFVDRNWFAERVEASNKSLDDFFSDGNKTVKPEVFISTYLNQLQEINHHLFTEGKMDKMRSYYLRKFSSVLSDAISINVTLIDYYSRKA